MCYNSIQKGDLTLKRIILFILILVNIIYAQKLYYIQFGSFRQLSVLERSINRLPYKMRSHVIIVNVNGWFIPFAYHTSKFYALKSILPKYKRYFPDARIASSPYILKHQVIRNYTNRIKKEYREYPLIRRPQYPIVAPNYHISYASTIKELPTIQEDIKPIKKYIRPKKVIPKIINNRFFNKKMLSGKHYYLTYKSRNGTPNLLIKVSFGNYKVTYQPIVGTMNMKEAKYLVENGRLYMFADTFSTDGAFSKIEDIKKDYIVVSSWFNGKKINTLRYYYDLNKAKEYLGERSLGKLATALEDGEFDRVHQAFIGVDGIYTTDDEDW